MIDTITLAENLNTLKLAENDGVQRCKGRTSWESSRIENNPHSHIMGGTPERQPRTACYHTEARSIKDNILSRRTHCRYVFWGREISLEDAEYGPVKLCDIVRDAMLSHYELYKIARILHSDTLPSCL